MICEGPDFICPGLPKSGTGWLFDQLEVHPDFWMPPVKELLYLNETIPQLRFVEDRSLSAIERTDGRPGTSVGERKLRRRLSDARDQSFVAYALSIRGFPRDLDRYAALFQFKGDRLSGDMSPPYWDLEEEMVASIGKRFPSAKILLLVRDPVARAWSRISAFHRSGKFDADLLNDFSGFADFLRQRRKAGGVSATAIAQLWRRHVPDQNFRVVLFDDIAEKPIATRDWILDFLGADRTKISQTLPPDFNRKADYQKLELTDAARAVLAEHFREEILASTAMFGGRAREWPSRYGL